MRSARALSSVAVPASTFTGCGFDNLLESINDQGDVAVVWHARKLLSPATLKRVAGILYWKPIHVGHVIFQFLCGVLFWLGLFHVVPNEITILSIALSVPTAGLYHGLDIDLSIAWYCVDFVYGVRLVITVVATTCTSAVLGWDGRAAMIPFYISLALTENVSEARCFQSRSSGRLPGLIVMTVLQCSTIALLSLARYPEMADVIVDMGTVGGIATIDKSFSVLQTAIGCWVSLVTFTWYDALHVLRGAAGLSQRIFLRPAPLRNEADFVMLDWLAKEPGVDGGLSMHA